MNCDLYMMMLTIWHIPCSKSKVRHAFREAFFCAEFSLKDPVIYNGPIVLCIPWVHCKWDYCICGCAHCVYIIPRQMLF